ncbi:MAG: Glutamine--scyllo-inositol transaminase [Dehalococcoidia bacterium]|nr:Glutamine--scyllo-inositol transaminase [Dehalococcoidia bacterium]
MKIPFVDLKRQYSDIKEEVSERVGHALQGMQLFLGENVQSLEKEFATYCGVRFGVGVGSGTDALHVALRACGIGPGDEVITVSHTFFATTGAIALTGAVPIFVDIDPETYCMDASQVVEKITPRTKALLPVHLYGHPADMQPILDIAERHKLWVIEDACQSHGAQYHGRKMGSLGHIGCFSFYFTKNLGAYGEGGMAVTNDPHLAETLSCLRNHGSRSKYEHLLLGINGRLDEIQAAILRIKLPLLDKCNAKRREVAAIYSACLPPTVVKPVERPGCYHVYHLYVIRTPWRDELKEWLGQRGIETGIHYPIPVHWQKACQSYSNGHNLPVTEKAVSEILSLPMYPELKAEEVIYICDCIKEFFEAKTAKKSRVRRESL